MRKIIFGSDKLQAIRNMVISNNERLHETFHNQHVYHCRATSSNVRTFCLCQPINLSVADCASPAQSAHYKQ